MAGIQIRQIVNSNLYLNGNSQIGKVEEAVIPGIKFKESEYKGMGLIGSLSLPAGIDKINCDLKFKSLFEDVQSAANNPWQAVELIFREEVESWDASGRNAQQGLITYMRGFPQESGNSTGKQGERREFPTKWSIHYLRQVFDGNELLELDLMNNIYTVDGVDLMANTRANLGI